MESFRGIKFTASNVFTPEDWKNTEVIQ